ncbi:unnamed protein product [Boreogadus saida]
MPSGLVAKPPAVPDTQRLKAVPTPHRVPTTGCSVKERLPFAGLGCRPTSLPRSKGVSLTTEVIPLLLLPPCLFLALPGKFVGLRQTLLYVPQRIGCLENEIPDGTQHFIDSIARMFANSTGVILLPKWAQHFSPHRYIAGRRWRGESLTYLLSNTQLSCKEVYGSVTELLLAGVDTFFKLGHKRCEGQA